MIVGQSTLSFLGALILSILHKSATVYDEITICPI